MNTKFMMVKIFANSEVLKVLKMCIPQVFCCLSLGSITVDGQPQLGEWISQMLGVARNPGSSVKYRLVQERQSFSEDSTGTGLQ